MNRDDIVTFGLALVAAVVTYYVVGTGNVDRDLMFVLAFVVFGVLIFVRSFVRTST